MPATSLGEVLDRLRQTWAAQAARDLSDGELLKRYAADGEDAAFTVLVQRHGAMVLAVGRRVLGDAHAAEDVWQATFMVLARRAGSINRRQPLNGWLYTVDQRLAAKARAQTSARQKRESRYVPGLQRDHVDELSLLELRQVLDEEIARLAEKYRLPIVLCHFEGKGQEQAAKLLGWHVTTFIRRLVQARELLRERLVRRGISLSVAALMAALTDKAAAAPVSTLLALNTVKAVKSYLAAKTLVVGCHSAQAVALADGTLRGLLGVNWKAVLWVLSCGFAVAAAGLGVRAAMVEMSRPGGGEKARAFDSKSIQVVKKQPNPTASVDQYGDLLPAEAVARLGTIRWRHGGQCGFVAFLPDGKSVLTAGADNLIRVWEFPSGKEIRHFGLGTRDEPDVPGPLGDLYHHPEFVPVALTFDGKTVATDLGSCGIRLYEVATGKELAALQQLSRFSVLGPAPGIALAFSPHGTRLASVDYEGAVTIWDWASAKAVRSFGHPVYDSPKPQTKFAAVPVLAYSPDGNQILTMNVERVEGKGSYFARLWNPENGSEIWKVHVGDKMAPLPADFSPDGRQLALAGTDGSVTILSAAAGKLVCKLQNDKVRQNTILFGPDGKTLFTHDRYLNVFEWDTATGKKLRELGAELPKRVGVRYFGDLSGARMALSRDARTLAVCGVENAPHFINLTTGKVIAEVVGPLKSIQALQFEPDGKRIWTRSLDNIFRLWDPATGKELSKHSFSDSSKQAPRTPDKKTKSGSADGSMPDALNQALISPDGKYVMRDVGDKCEIHLVELGTESEIAHLPSQKERETVEMLFTPDSKSLVLRWFKKSVVELLDVPSLQKRVTIGIMTRAASNPGGLLGKITPRTMIISPDSQRLAAYRDPKTLSVWDLAGGKKLLDLVMPENREVHNGAFTPDNRCLAINLNDGTVILYELATNKVRHVFGQTATPRTQMAPGNAIVALGSWGPEYSATTAIASGGKTLVHAGLDRKLHFWDLDTGKELAALVGHTAAIKAVAFSPDGKFLASASDDTTVLVWDMSKVQSPALVAKAMSTAELALRWNELKSSDAELAFYAIRDLMASPQETIAFLTDHLKPSPPIDAKLIEKYVADLSSEEFKARQRATAELLKFGEEAVPAIEKALAVQLPLEAKTRLEQLKTTLTNPVLTEEKLRVHRAVEILERIGSPEARQLLTALAGGAPGGYPTNMARAALKRLQSK